MAGSSLDDDHPWLVRLAVAYTGLHIGFPAGVPPCWGEHTVAYEHGSGEIVEVSVHIPFVRQDFARRMKAAGTHWGRRAYQVDEGVVAVDDDSLPWEPAHNTGDVAAAAAVDFDYHTDLENHASLGENPYQHDHATYLDD